MSTICKTHRGVKLASLIEAAAKQHKTRLIAYLSMINLKYQTYYQWKTGRREPNQMVMECVVSRIKELKNKKQNNKNKK